MERLVAAQELGATDGSEPAEVAEAYRALAAAILQAVATEVPAEVMP
ncbi:MAG: hypothetical protein M3072_15025 [Candidatus Dormibacteraeota bacterium]|nr:hypothetical protein [Candidatus Dormibacteraeota bacterium]